MSKTNSRSPRKRQLGVTSSAKRRGTIIVLAALLMIVMMGMLAFSIDLGYMYTTQSELKRAVDAAALAGAGGLVNGQDEANERTVEYLLRNPVGSTILLAEGDDLDAKISEFLVDHEDDLEVTMGHWDSETREMTESAQLPSTLSVSMTYTNRPLFFGKIFGRDSFSVTAQTIAMYQPRDIVVVFDLSGSMNDDSELKSIDTLGQDAIEENLAEMWADLGSPVLGDLTFTPEYVTIPGITHDDTSVTWRDTHVDFESDSTIQKVRLYYSSRSYQQSTVNSSSFTKYLTGSKSGKQVRKVKVKIGGVWETTDFYSTSTIKRGLGLTGVDCPSTGGWSGYFYYARNDGDAEDAGYACMFGGLTLLDHWLDDEPAADETPDLWKVSAQPITAVKDATDVFMDYMREVDTDDRVGLAIYNSNNGEGQIEETLTSDLDAVVDTAELLQAGHYHSYTNIGAGLKAAREELEENGRDGAFKLIILMTDGNANWVDGDYDTSGADAYVMSEAQKCLDNKYPVVTVSLGAGADTSIMEAVAELTNGTHFNVPGGQSVDDYSEDLQEVFHDIASDRPLKIVQ